MREDDLIERLLGGDAEAFDALVRQHTPGMLRVARRYCGRHGSAEDVVQDTWIAVLDGLPSFQRRARLRTWIFRILANRAMSTGKRAARSVPMSAIAEPGDATDKFTADGSWASPPVAWVFSPETALDNAQLRVALDQAIDALPERQRMVVVLRDVQGLPSAEVCEILDLSEVNQRVLLHRARTRVRDALADFMAGER